MSANIFQLPIQVPAMVGVLPNSKYMVVGDNLATLTTAGYLNQVSLESNPVSATDVIQCLYSFNPATQTGTYGVFSVTISNGTITLSPNFLLNSTANASAIFNKISLGATPIALVDPGSSTITAVAGAANTSTITIQLKDGSGTNITNSVLFRVYASSAANGLTLASAASTGFSVASGGLSLANGTAVTTQITAMSSATGSCVLSLLDTAKQTSYLVLVLPNGNKISAQLTTGSYG